MRRLGSTEHDFVRRSLHTRLTASSRPTLSWALAQERAPGQPAATLVKDGARIPPSFCALAPGEGTVVTRKWSPVGQKRRLTK